MINNNNNNLVEIDKLNSTVSVTCNNSNYCYKLQLNNIVLET